MNRIAELRQKRKLSMMQAAKELNIPYTTYVNYEKGDREPNSEMLIKLADYFEVSIDYLIGRSEDMVSNVDINESINNDLKVALFGGKNEVTDEMWEEVVNFAKYIEAREAQKNKKD